MWISSIYPHRPEARLRRLAHLSDCWKFVEPFLLVPKESVSYAGNQDLRLVQEFSTWKLTM